MTGQVTLGITITVTILSPIRTMHVHRLRISGTLVHLKEEIYLT